MLMKSCKQEEKERRENVHPGFAGNLNHGPPEWQPSVLTTTPCHIHIFLNFWCFQVSLTTNKMSVYVKIEEPDIFLVENLDDKNSDALMMNTELQ